MRCAHARTHARTHTQVFFIAPGQQSYLPVYAILTGTVEPPAKMRGLFYTGTDALDGWHVYGEVHAEFASLAESLHSQVRATVPRPALPGAYPMDGLSSSQ